MTLYMLPSCRKVANVEFMSRYQYWYPWSSLATPPYHPLLQPGLQGYIPYRHGATGCRFELVVLPLLVYVKGSTGVHHLWARPNFSSSVPHVWADKMKRSFFEAAVVLILLYGCTTLTLTKRMEKKLDGNYTIMLRAILNKSWRQHPTMQQPYGHLRPITKTSKIRRTRHTGHGRSRDKLISDVLLWTPSHGRKKAGRSALNYIQQLCADMGCSPEDLPEAMEDREGWLERVGDIRADSATWKKKKYT